MTELQPLIRIGLYILAGYLLEAGLPAPAARILTDDPAMLELVSMILSGVITGLTLCWWRIAKSRGWGT